MSPRARVWATLLFACACRPGEGDNCVCEGECRGGLVCARGGQVLQPGECVAASTKSEPGRCIQSENLPEGTSSLGEPPDVHDVGSKRDFQPGHPVGDSSSEGSGSSTGTSSTGTSSTGTSSTGTSSTGTSSTGTSSTGSGGSGLTGSSSSSSGAP